MEELQSKKEKLLKEKATLEAAKKSGDGWTKEQQNRLNNVAILMVDVETEIENLAKEPVRATDKAPYVPAKGTEKLVHLMLSRGNRYSAKTGKEINPPYRQVFTYPEWQLFKVHHKGLGYTITEVLFDPYGEAEAYVEKTEDEQK